MFVIFKAEEGDEKDDVETEDDNDGFFVPHGYLSDDEGVQDSEEENENDSDERETLSDVNKARRDSHARVCPIQFVSFPLIEVSQATK